MSSKISWTDQTYNPIIGCSKCSPGCQNCYAERMARRQCFMRPGCEYADVVGESGWNGKTALVKSALTKPLHWKNPRRIFVCSMGVLFHESVPFEWIDQVFAVMALCPQHTFQILTKRPDRMREYLAAANRRELIEERIGIHARDWGAGRQAEALGGEWDPGQYDGEGRCEMAPGFGSIVIPLPHQNVWLGATCENQEQADKRIPHLLKCQAAVRFISVEPMLGTINFREIKPLMNAFNSSPYGWHEWLRRKLHLVICGGESGPNARPMHPDWVRSLRDQCVAASVPFHFKQWGEYLHSSQIAETDIDPDEWNHLPIAGTYQTRRVGKTRAGCLIDGNEWKQFPEVTP